MLRARVAMVVDQQSQHRADAKLDEYLASLKSGFWDRNQVPAAKRFESLMKGPHMHKTSGRRGASLWKTSHFGGGARRGADPAGGTGGGSGGICSE